MSSLEDKDFDQILRDKLDGHQLRPTKNLLPGILNAIDKTKPGGETGSLKWGIIPGVLLMLLTGYFLLNANQKNENIGSTDAVVSIITLESDVHDQSYVKRQGTSSQKLSRGASKKALEATSFSNSVSEEFTLSEYQDNSQIAVMDQLETLNENVESDSKFLNSNDTKLATTSSIPFKVSKKMTSRSFINSNVKQERTNENTTNPSSFEKRKPLKSSNEVVLNKSKESKELTVESNSQSRDDKDDFYDTEIVNPSYMVNNDALIYDYKNRLEIKKIVKVKVPKNFNELEYPKNMSI